MPWIDGKYYYQQQKIYTDEIKFISPPQTLSNATQMLVVDSNNIIRQQALVNAVGGNNMWYESWHMTTEGIDSSNNYANVAKKVFYHGFKADTTGEYTNMQVRIENTSSGTAASNLTMKVAIYDSTNISGNVRDSSPHPNMLQGEGSGIFPLGGGASDYGTHSYIDIRFDSSISVTRGKIYFVALFYTGGIDGLFGLGDNNTSSGTHHFSYTSVDTSVSSFISPVPTNMNYLEKAQEGAYWFTVYGLQSAAGATQGPAGADGADGADGANGADGADGVDGADGADGVDGADGAAGPSTGSVSFYTDYGSKTNNPPPPSGTAPKLLANGNTDVTNGTTNSTGFKGYPIYPQGVGGQASALGIAYSGLVGGSNANIIMNQKPMIYGSYMHRSGRIVGVGTNVHYEYAGVNGTPKKIEPYVVVYGGAGGSAYESQVGNWVYTWGGTTTATTPTNGNPPESGWYGSANRLATGLTFKAGDYIGIYVPEDNSGTSTTAPFFSVEGTLYLVFD